MGVNVEHKHQMKLHFCEEGIDRGECPCGAVQYFPRVFTAKYLTRVKELNSLESKVVEMNDNVKPIDDDAKEDSMVIQLSEEEINKSPGLKEAITSATITESPNGGKVFRTHDVPPWEEIVQEAHKLRGTMPTGYIVSIADKYQLSRNLVKTKYLNYLKTLRPPAPKKRKGPYRDRMSVRTNIKPNLSSLPPIPPKPPKTETHKLSRYYEQNKDQILSEVKQYGQEATKRRWGISNSGWVNISLRWSKTETKPVEKSPAAPAKPSNGLPPFPEFDKSWEMLVKIKWFEIYERLARRE